MYKYQYKSPLEKGFIKINIPKKEVKQLFPKDRKINTFNKTDCFYHPEKEIFIVEFLPNILAKIYFISIIPLAIFLYGIKGVKEEWSSFFNVKKYGHFIEEKIYLKNKDPDNIKVKIIQKHLDKK